MGARRGTAQPVRLLLDEMIGPRVAKALRERGHDVEAVVELTALRGLADEPVLQHAAATDRVLVTRNIADFAQLHQRWQVDARAHAGLLFITESAFPQNRNLVGALVSALLAADSGSALPGAHQAHYLQPAPPT